MALDLLWLSLTLLGILQIQASGKIHVPRSMKINLSKIHLESNFNEDRFQGKWYALAVAENTIQNGSDSQFQMYSSTFYLNDDHSYNVTTKRHKGRVCDCRIMTLVPSYVPGQFELDNIKCYPGILLYTMRVSFTNYNQYALIFVKMQFKHILFYEATLYGRTKHLNADLKDRFIDFATFIGFNEENMIFHDPVEECIDN
uniref:Lipocalin/cytosolic fatty-acid binding domain-containing protein n=1 Tax=Cavia porcellus TaxID=10141 RepID=H0WBB7_CAVPO